MSNRRWLWSERKARFLDGLVPEPNTGCLIFLGETQKGYGRLILDGRRVQAHRLAWQIEHGPISAGLTLDHRAECVKSCCNVRHLQLVTRARNTALASERLTHCARGHNLRAAGVVKIRTDGRRRCVACRRIDQWMRYAHSEVEAERGARASNPVLFAAADSPIGGVMVRRSRRST